MTSVASSVWSQSSRAMIEMLITGETDPVVLAELAKGRMRPKIPDLIEALERRWLAQHSTVACQLLVHIDFIDDTIQNTTPENRECVGPFHVGASVYTTHPGDR